MTPTIQNHRVTAPAWQTVVLTESCDPPGSTPPDKKTRAPLAQRCDPPGSTPPDKKTGMTKTEPRVAAVAQA